MINGATLSRPELEDIGLAICERLLATHLADVERGFGPAGLGVIDLPPLRSGALIGSQIRVVATLYWARELEEAGILPFVESIAQGVISGTWLAPIGAAIHPLVAFARRRDQRFTRPERQALFDRLFGGINGGGDDFDRALRAFAEAVAAIGREPADQGIAHLEARAAETGRTVGTIASSGGVGVAGFAARDIVEQIRTALGLLQHPDLSRALGGGGPWQILMRHGQAALGRALDVMRRLSRARAGLALIEWIAREADGIERGRSRILRQAPIVSAAETWLAASGSP
jgi:hypothetical protein